nr:transcription initiation factor TFIID subunit 3 [Halyomorpha halys]
MVDSYTRHAIRVSVAQICQIIGWTSIHSSPLEILTDILQEYIFNLSKIASNYAMLYGQTEPNMNHLALAFKDMGISLTELEEYVTYVETSSVLEVPKYPIPKDSHLNHLKPGSREVLTRPVHIHEHLPPMHPHLEDRDYILSKSPLSIDITTSESLSPLSSPKSVFKKPGDPVMNERRSRPLLDDNEVRPLREISSVMMTTSGFLSPAREGKLPEARTVPIEFNRSSLSPEDSNLVEQNIELKIDKKKKPKIPDIKKIDKENKMKEENRDQRETEDEFKVKKLVNSKETSKLKALKTGAQKMPPKPPSPLPIQKKPKVQLSPTASQTNFVVKPQKEKSPKNDKKPLSPPNKDLFIPSLPIPNRDPDIDVKLPSEPDKQKLNILKKISKVKEEPEESKNSVIDGRENSSFSFDPVPHSTPLNRKHINDNNSLVKEYEEEIETPIDVENSSPPSIFEYNRLPPPEFPKITEVPKTPEVKKKKKDKKEKRELDHDRDSYSKTKNHSEDLGKSKHSAASHDITFPEETQTPSFPGLTCPVSPAPGLIPWNNPLFPSANPVSPGLNLINYPNFPKKSQDIPTTVQQSSFSSMLTSNSSQIPSGSAPLPSFSNKDNTILLSKKKERKREKKLKEKMKKKKEKKEKNRSKDKSGKKKLKKEKKKDKELATEERSEVNTVPKITFKLGPVSPKDSSAESCTRKMKSVIKPIIKKEENETVAEAYVVPEIPKPPSNSNPTKTKSSKAGKSHIQTKPEIPEKPPTFSCATVLSVPKPEPVSSITKWDGDANQQMWICPACSRPDDGSPMIACDLCDYWYHWTCVGIQEDIESDWYCELCVLRREEGCSEKKKKHRKKKT